MDKKDTSVERWTSRVLLAGVLVSGCLMVVGLIAASVFPSTIIALSEKLSLGSLFSDIFSGAFDPAMPMFAGLVVLMFTPILRVVTATIGFAVERDWRFVFVSIIVLIMLLAEIIYSFFIT